MTLKKVAVAAGAALLGGLVACAGVLFWNIRDNHPGYALNLSLQAGPTRPISAGFSALSVTPSVPDPWTDRNGNGQFDDEDSWQDGNANGRFDGVWLAGFQNRRPATGVHDDLWARAMVLADGRARVAIVAVDSIGLMQDQVIDIRSRLPDSLGLDHLIVTSTHTHQAPDVMGLWGPSRVQSGVDDEYLEMLVSRTARAVEAAVANLRPAVLRFAQADEGPEALVTDSRPPRVLDSSLRLLQATDAVTGETLGTLVGWANHPETVWSGNLLISSDFPHYLRESIEKGLRQDTEVVVPGLGGIAVYANGAIGGLMTTDPTWKIPDPFSDTVYTEPSFEKARAQGQQLARLALSALRRDDVIEVREASIALQARTLELPVDNPLFMFGAGIGALPRGFVRFGVVRSEVSAFTIGPASFLSVPGEIYPEILNGGVTSPTGADFQIEPVEIPPLRDQMPGRYRFVLGLANDAIGYIIPKSEWDDEAPWLDGSVDETYGEIVSLGPDTAPLLHAELSALLSLLSSD